MNFAYVSFVNNNDLYIDLMKTTIKSVLIFSRHSLILYCVDFDGKTVFPENDRLILRNLMNIKLPSIYYFKPFIILDSLLNGLKHGYYIESDDVMTPFCDNVFLVAQQLRELPISPLHPETHITPFDDMIFLKIKEKTQDYIHGHVVFKDTNLRFKDEWLHECLKDFTYTNADESVLNCMYWRYGCKNYYIGNEQVSNDPYFTQFYTRPEIRMIDYVFSFHGCKNPVEQDKLLDDMIEFYGNQK